MKFQTTQKITFSSFLIMFLLALSLPVLGVTDTYGIPVDKPQECLRILQDFKIKLTTTVGTAASDVTLKRGAIIAPSPIDAVATLPNPKCSHLKVNEGIVVTTNLCSGTEISDRCYLLLDNEFGGIALLNTIVNISNWVFYIVIIISTIMIVFGGFTYITSSGDPTKSGKGKSIITFALIGLAVALLAKVLPSVMKFFLGL